MAYMHLHSSKAIVQEPLQAEFRRDSLDRVILNSYKAAKHIYVWGKPETCVAKFSGVATAKIEKDDISSLLAAKVSTI